MPMKQSVSVKRGDFMLWGFGSVLPVRADCFGHKSTMYSPLAWVIIWGLISSTLLARLVTPVMYKLMPPEV